MIATPTFCTRWEPIVASCLYKLSFSGNGLVLDLQIYCFELTVQRHAMMQTLLKEGGLVFAVGSPQWFPVLRMIREQTDLGHVRASSGVHRYVIRKMHMPRGPGRDLCQPEGEPRSSGIWN